MRNTLVLTLASFAIVSALSAVAVAEQNHKVLMIVKGDSEEAELMLTKEVGVMTDMLEQAGFEVEVATASGQPMVAGAATLQSDVKLEDVKMADYSGLIIPCMGVGLEEPAHEAPKAAAIVKDAVAAGKPVAAQVASVVILAEAGVLAGKNYAFPSEEAAGSHPTLEKATYSGNGIVQDGNIITSGVCPLAARNRGLEDGTPNLTKAFISELAGVK